MSLINRRKLLLHNTQSGGSDEPEMISVLIVDTNTIPFPYSEDKPYAFLLQNSIKSSNHPFYILKASYRDYKLFTTDEKVLGGSWAVDHITEDTSELGDGIYLKDKWTKDFSSFGVCNYPVQEVRYSDDGTKLYIVRE